MARALPGRTGGFGAAIDRAAISATKSNAAGQFDRDQVVGVESFAQAGDMRLGFTGFIDKPGGRPHGAAGGLADVRDGAVGWLKKTELLTGKSPVETRAERACSPLRVGRRLAGSTR